MRERVADKRREKREPQYLDHEIGHILRVSARGGRRTVRLVAGSREVALSVGVDYEVLFGLRRLNPIIPTRALPKSQAAAGSGIGLIVSVLE